MTAVLTVSSLLADALEVWRAADRAIERSSSSRELVAAERVRREVRATYRRLTQPDGVTPDLLAESRDVIERSRAALRTSRSGRARARSTRQPATADRP